MVSDPDVAARLKKLAKNRKYEELEEAVLEAILEETVDREALLTVLLMTARRADPGAAESLAWLGITSYAEARGDEEGLLLARGVAEGLPQSAVLREELADLYRRVNAAYPSADMVVERLVAGSDLPLPVAVARADQALDLPPGTYVVKRGRKDPGRVIGVAEGGRAIEVEFAAGVTAFPFEDLSMLAVLEPTDFRALAVFEPERLAERAQSDPVGLVEDLLRATGGSLNYRELRAHLVSVVDEDWSAWWNRVRSDVERSRWVEISAGRQPTLSLRRKALEHDERVGRDFDAAASPEEKFLTVLAYLDQAGDHAAAEEALVRHLAGGLLEIAAENDPSTALAAGALLFRLAAKAPEAVPEPPPPPDLETANPADLLFPLTDPRLQKAALDYVKVLDPEGWPDFLAAAFPALGSELCGGAARELSEAGREEELPRIARTILEHPNEFAEALIWVYKAVENHGLLAAEDGPDPERLLIDFIAVTDRAARESRGALASKLRSALATRNYAPARRLLEAMSDRSVRRVRESLDRFPGLTDHARVHLTDLLAETHPEIFSEEVPLWEQEDVILTTQAGYDKKQEEYSEFVNEKLPAIATAIGRAASHGDLSENAEYTAALEERERLTERANSLKAALDQAVVLAPEAADGDTVTVGSRVRVRDARTGEERTLTFLGPWDVDVTIGVYSYRAPLSLAFMGRAVGDTVAVELHGEPHRYEILEVASALR